AEVTPFPPSGTCPKGLAAWPVAARLGEPSKVTRTSRPLSTPRTHARSMQSRLRLGTPELGSLRCCYRQSLSRTERSESIAYRSPTVKSAVSEFRRLNDPFF